MAKILAVDDVPVVQLTARRVLEQVGHVVIEAEDGSKGFAPCQAEAFDLLLDIFTPGMDAFETMRRIPKRQPDLPTVMISRRPHTPDLLRALDCSTTALKPGAVSSLPTPFKPAQ